MWGQKPGFYSSLYVGFSGGLCEVAIFSLIAGGVRTAQRVFLMRGPVGIGFGSLLYRRDAPLSKRIMRFDLTGGCNRLTIWLAVILRPHLGNAYDI